jgi:putative two-component system response regulator
MDEGIDSIHTDLRTAMRRRSTRSYRHGQRVGLLAAAFGDWLGLDASHIGRLRHAAELHDIGKLALSAELLEKPGALDAQEWHSMRLHPIIGHRLLRQGHGSRAEMAAMVALQHHECWDGSGYPCGLSGAAISAEARIVAICDVYDALREERAYKPALLHDHALDLILHGDGTGRLRPAMFDPALLVLLKVKAGAFMATYATTADEL